MRATKLALVALAASVAAEPADGAPTVSSTYPWPCNLDPVDIPACSGTAAFFFDPAAKACSTVPAHLQSASCDRGDVGLVGEDDAIVTVRSESRFYFKSKADCERLCVLSSVVRPASKNDNLVCSDSPCSPGDNCVDHSHRVSCFVAPVGSMNPAGTHPLMLAMLLSLMLTLSGHLVRRLQCYQFTCYRPN
ncbi:hypothetical protein HK105_204948 [Polyrhizophydium stewartii]|uniref:Uncharacterized protein n=1 Tax=Polyrhizophydium stewartii TaxID=2732419 RepID=A0ABR4N7Q1_9FUNG|nr:hypothetical protein HK105_005543 [Polyrhizophydium stewartii]